MDMITKEMPFSNNVMAIINNIESNYKDLIQSDFDNEPTKYTDLMTWLELNPEIVGKQFMNHVINYGFTNDDIS